MSPTDRDAVGGVTLTDKRVKTAKGQPEAYKLADQAGLYLYVSASGAKSWRYDYRVAGRRHTLTIGQYPLVPLKEARDLHTDAHRAVGARQATCRLIYAAIG